MDRRTQVSDLDHKFKDRRKLTKKKPFLKALEEVGHKIRFSFGIFSLVRNPFPALYYRVTTGLQHRLVICFLSFPSPFLFCPLGSEHRFSQAFIVSFLNPFLFCPSRQQVIARGTKQRILCILLIDTSWLDLLSPFFPSSRSFQRPASGSGQKRCNTVHHYRRFFCAR